MKYTENSGNWKLILMAFLAVFMLSGCSAVKDYMPDYLGGGDASKVSEEKPAAGGSAAPAPSQPAETKPEVTQPATPATEEQKPVEVTEGCTVYLDSTLCVQVKSETLQFGVDPALCTKVDPIPIHVDKEKLFIKGNEFPTITVQDPNLPIPLMIDGKGETDGTNNIAQGTYDASGNVSIKNLSIFITALGMTGELKGLTLTTDKVGGMAYVPDISGQPMDKDGNVTLVIGLDLPSLFPAADAILLGASLTAIFTGKITPTFENCTSGVTPPPSGSKVKVSKLSYIGEEETEEGLPSGTDMFIGTAFIPKTDEETSSSYKAVSKFKITNISKENIDIKLPAEKGRFIIEAETLEKTLAPEESLAFSVTFAPKMGDQVGGVSEEIDISGSKFYLKAEAQASGSKIIVNTVSESTGQADKDNISTIDFGSVSVNAAPKQDFFTCKSIDCEAEQKLTDCAACTSPDSGTCHLLPVDINGKPIGVVDSNCKASSSAAEDLTMNLGGGNGKLHSKKELIEIRNNGTEEITITNISIKDASKSTGQFHISANSIFVVSGEAPMDELLDNLENTPLPITLPPYNDSSAVHVYIVVTYEPTDLIGSEEGSSIKDKAELVIETSNQPMTIQLVGATNIAQTPPLEAYIKTTDGFIKMGDGSTFAYRGIGGSNTKSGAPLYIKTSEGATSPIVIKKAELGGRDAANFEWKSSGSVSCPITGFDTKSKQTVQETVNLNAADLSKGLEVSMGLTQDNMPALGCLIFNMPTESSQPQYISELKISANKLSGGTSSEINFMLKFIAVTNPMDGKYVLRITQTFAAVQARKFPSISATASDDEFTLQKEAGLVIEEDRSITLAAVEFDPFDERELLDRFGQVISTPNDSLTASFRAIDTHPTTHTYEDPYVYDFMSLIHDGTLPTNEQGVFFDYPNVPKDLKASSLRIFTATLSYPGPLGSPRPEGPSQCQEINPCDSESTKLFNKKYVPAGGKGACAFFNTTAASYASPALHPKEYEPNKPEPMENGELGDLCTLGDKPQNLNDGNKGHISVDGRATFEDMGLRFFGPTYVHNPYGPVEPKPDLLDVVFHISFTTEVLSPKGTPEGYVTVPDKRLLDENRYFLNLTDESLESKPICKNNVKNKKIGDKDGYSSWKYLAPFLSQDEEGTIPAGCPEDDNDFTGGLAYVKGRPIDRETGIVSVAAVGTFGGSEEMTFAFQDATIFVIMNGWFCDPNGSSETPYFEGKYCYDPKFNERDFKSQTSVMEEDEN